LYLDKLNIKEDARVEQRTQKESGSENIEVKALLEGILLGGKEGLSEEQVENFKISNLSHILAVSGMHIAYIILATMTVFSLFNIRKQMIHIFTIFIIIFFMFLTEFTPSVVRASIMGILVLMAFFVKRKSDVWVNISIASLISLIYNPHVLFSLSYQLSYLGTIGIVLGMKVVNVFREKKVKIGDSEIYEEEAAIKRKSKKSINEKIVDKIKEIKRFFLDTIIVCISAQIFIFPIILLNFNTFSVYFLISNILISPIIGIIVILGFLVILVSYVCLPLAYCLNYVEKCLLEFINIMTTFISNLPSSIINLKTPYLISIIIYYILIIFIIGCFIAKEAIIKRKINKYYKNFIGMLKKFLIVYIIIILVVDIGIFERGSTRIYFIDVGQGDCSLIITSQNKKILIDGGGSYDDGYDVGENVTLPYLLDRRISRLDYVIISHFDSDHVQGLWAVLENIKVDNIVISKQYELTANFEKFLEIVREKKLKVLVVKMGDVIKVDKSSRIEILFPVAEVKEHILQNQINNNSIVCKYVDKNVSVLYTGDIEKVAEEKLVSFYKGTRALEAEILKIAHHGSKTSTTSDFLDLVKPKIAVISVGRNNTFGHPNVDVIERLIANGTVVRRTDIEGEVEMKFRFSGDDPFW